MKRKNKLVGLAAVLLLLSITNYQPSTQAQGTAFTYQGFFTDGGRPANGRYDFILQVFDAASAGNSLGDSQATNGVPLTNGLFTVVLDFGSAPFTGPARWLQIQISTNGAGSYATLVPRQPLTPAPYAIFAQLAGNVTNGAINTSQLAAGAVNTSQLATNAVDGSRIASNQVVKSLNALQDNVTLVAGPNVTLNTVGNSLQISAPAGGLALPYSGTASSTGSIFTISNSSTGPAGVFLGKVGLGTANPQSLLDVNGSIRWGGAVTNFAYSGEDEEGLFIEQVGGTSARSNIRFQSSKSGNANDYSQFFIDPNNGFSFMSLGTGNGFVGIGTTTPGYALDVNGTVNVREQLAVGSGLSVGGGLQVFGNLVYLLGGEVISLDLNVYGNAYKPGGGSWANNSDARVKKNIQSLTGALARLTQLHGVSFEWVNPGDHANQTGPQGGFVAQEVERVFPHWVTEVPGAEHDRSLTPDGRVKSLSLPFEFDALVVEAIKEQQQQIEARDAEIGELKSELAEVKVLLLQI